MDGYDLGVGFWHLLARSSNARRSLRSAITPYWDANEVWLITAGGALFAAFPMVYATVFSGFYPALMLLIFALVFRGVSIEYVAHASDKAKGLWEVAFGAGSTLAALLFGIAAGNLMRGLPLDAQGNFTGSFVDLFGWFPLLTGVAGLALFAMHGGLFFADESRRDGRGDGKEMGFARLGCVFDSTDWLLFRRRHSRNGPHGEDPRHAGSVAVLSAADVMRCRNRRSDRPEQSQAGVFCVHAYLLSCCWRVSAPRSIPIWSLHEARAGP